MARRRKRDKHLPQRMYLHHGTYLFVPKGAPKVNLGRDLSAAIAKYATIIGSLWAGRTVGDLIARYRAEVLPLKRAEQTRDTQGTQLARLAKAFGHMLPDNVTSQMCYAYADARRDAAGKPVPVAARHEVSLLGHVFRYGIRWGIATANPARNLDMGERKKREQVTLLQVEALKLHTTNERVHLMIDLAVSTGQRLGDILSFKREDVTADGLMIRQGKTGAKLAMEVTPTLAALIERAKAMKPQLGSPYLVRTRAGKRYTESGFKAIWQRLMRRHVEAGGVRFTFHDLRSVSADGAATLEEARDRLGHATADTTQRFYRRAPRKARPLA